MEIILILVLAVLSFLIGFLVKFVDFIEDDLKLIKKNVFLKKLSFPLGVLYGCLIAFVLFSWPILFPLAIGTILGEVFSKKIDKKSHLVAILMLVLFCVLLILLGRLTTNLNVYFAVLLFIFLLASLLDELTDKFIEKIRKKNILTSLFSFRPFLEVTAFIISLITNEWIIWVTIFSFDLAYIFSTKLFKNIFIKRI